MPERTRSSKKFWRAIIGHGDISIVLNSRKTGFVPLLMNKGLFNRLSTKYGFPDKKFASLDFEYVTIQDENCVYVGDHAWMSVHKVYVRDNMAVCDCPTFKFRCRKKGQPCNHIVFLMIYGIWKPEYFLGYV